MEAMVDESPRMNPRFSIGDTPLHGLKLLERMPIGDSRGFFERLFCATEMGALLGGRTLAQINHTLTQKSGAIRGLHFQHPPHVEAKIVSCIRGAIFDVAVDLRTGSPTFLNWHADTLSAENNRMMFIPEGFAHGFQTLTGNCEVIYFHTASYNPASEGGLNFRDPRLAVRWPQDVTEYSARDGSFAFVAADFPGVAV